MKKTNFFKMLLDANLEYVSQNSLRAHLARKTK